MTTVLLSENKLINSHVEEVVCHVNVSQFPVMLRTQVRQASIFKVLGAALCYSLVLWRVLRESLKLFLSPKCLKFVEQLRMLQTSGQMQALALKHNMENCPNRSSLYISREIPNMWNTLMHSNCISATVVAREQTEITNFISFRKYLYLKPKSWVLE